MTALRHAGERIGRYSLAKRQAVQQEDFITAKLRKEQIELYRRLVFEHLLVDKLLELDGVSVCCVSSLMFRNRAVCLNGWNPQPTAANDQVCIVYAQKPVLPAAPSLQDVATAMLSTNSSSSCAPNSSVSSAGAAGVPLDGCSATASTSSTTMTPSSPMLGVGTAGGSGGHAGRSSSKRTSPTRSRGNSLHRRNKSAPRNSFEDYEERAVPALKQ